MPTEDWFREHEGWRRDRRSSNRGRSALYYSSNRGAGGEIAPKRDAHHTLPVDYVKIILWLEYLTL